MNDDLISREELKHFVNYEMNTDRMYETEERRDSCYAFRDELFKYIDNAPTVDLDERDADAFETGYIKGLCENRPTGEWILHGMIYYCSKCGHECGESGDNFCGNCGARMEADYE